MFYQEYKKDYLDDVIINAQIDGTTPDDYFLTDFLDKLSTMGEIIDSRVMNVYKKNIDGNIMAFDAYAFDESDKSFILVSNEYISDNTDNKITLKDVEQIKNRMLYYIEESYNDNLKNFFDITDDALQIGAYVSKRFKIDYTDGKEEPIDKIKLYIITNEELEEDVHHRIYFDFLDKKCELNIWNIHRLYVLYESGKEREPLLIDIKKYGIEGIPCIKAEMQSGLDYDAYLAIVPGHFLNDIYYEHGSRLLEGNVRAFLSNRGKINKGIRETIKREPTKFFTYNNGIACTASRVELSKDNRNIVCIEDLQIINGGQTTASLTSAHTKDKLSLDNIFVPMKLTVIKNNDYDIMIQNIAKYANSQNKVTDADLFSNHPFHIAFEKLSRKIQAPAKDNSTNNTYWYYERARGKYEQEQFKMKKKLEKDIFVAKYPKKQVIKKEELAKYYTCGELQRPDIVSKGSQKSMLYFAQYIDDQFQKNQGYFGESFYKKCICYAIIFRSTDRIVNYADWYNVGGYKLNIVPYTISKLLSCIPEGKCLDFDTIWKKQEVYESLNYELERIAKKTNEFIQKSNGVIVTEYCKKEETWEKYKDVKYELSNIFLQDLVSIETEKSKTDSDIKTAKLNKEVDIEIEIYNLGGRYWRNLIEEGRKRKILSPTEIDFLNIAASSDSANPVLPSPKQAKIIWKIRKKLDDAGILV